VAAAERVGGVRGAAHLQTRAEEIQSVLRGEHLGLSDTLAEAYGASVRSLVAVLTTMVDQVRVVGGGLGRHSELRSSPASPASVRFSERARAGRCRCRR